MTDPAPEPVSADIEEIDAVPVLAEVRAIEPVAQPGALVVPVAVQAVAVGAAGLVAGVAAVTVAHRRLAGRKTRRLSRRDLGPITSTRSFLVHVHTLDRR